MAVTVTTPARNIDLTTLARLKEELGVTVTTSDDLLTAMVRRASAAVEAYCHRVFAREVVSEMVAAYGGPYLQLNRYPVATVSTVAYNGSTWTDYSLYDKAAGVLYRQDGWAWSAQSWPGLTGGRSFADFGSPLPGSEEPLVVTSYVAGYLLPADNVLASADVSADATTDTFSHAGAGFPTLLKAGDVIETAGFSSGANNGRFLVTGTPTAAAIPVTGALATEAATTGAHSVLAQTLPYDLEKATLECAKFFYLGRQTDPGVVEKQVGPMRLRYSESDNVTRLGLPPSVVGLLAPYVRRAG